ncbi:MAG: 4Fe-4S binding protein [Candidatus Omnitrophota bacterium]|jgi:polyferredoxin|nr:MAG: 4Fe-4S binding protein [Candidatus Omnitrophota bacterium]
MHKKPSKRAARRAARASKSKVAPPTDITQAESEESPEPEIAEFSAAAIDESAMQAGTASDSPQKETPTIAVKPETGKAGRAKHKQKGTSLVVWLRRTVQAFFLLFFLYLFLQTTYHPINVVGGPVTFFFELDPLVMIATWLAVHAIPAALLLSFLTLIVTFFFGRWFCGWICPFGVLHNLFTCLRGKRLLTRIESATFSRWQRGKYYVLVAFLTGAFAGVSAIGWLDPFSFFYRSLATAVYPAMNWGLQAPFTWLYHVDPGVGGLKVTTASEPIYDVLRTYFLALDQPHYHGALLIGLLFITVVALNLFRARFWCRYICPLGALLGVVGKNPLLRLHKDVNVCNDCRICIADCHGGAEPNKTDGWKPSECFYCWNCDSSCPHDAISFTFEQPTEKKP